MTPPSSPVAPTTRINVLSFPCRPSRRASKLRLETALIPIRSAPYLDLATTAAGDTTYFGVYVTACVFDRL